MAKKTKQQLLVDTFLPHHEAQLRKDLAVFVGKVREAGDEDHGHNMRDAIRWHVFPTLKAACALDRVAALRKALAQGTTIQVMLENMRLDLVRLASSTGGRGGHGLDHEAEIQSLAQLIDDLKEWAK